MISIDEKEYKELQELKLTMDKLSKGNPCIVKGAPVVLRSVSKDNAISTSISNSVNHIERLIESHAETGIDFCTDESIICPTELKELINVELCELVSECHKFYELPYWEVNCE